MQQWTVYRPLQTSIYRSSRTLDTLNVITPSAGIFTVEVTARGVLTVINAKGATLGMENSRKSAFKASELQITHAIQVVPFCFFFSFARRRDSVLRLSARCICDYDACFAATCRENLCTFIVLLVWTVACSAWTTPWIAWSVISAGCLVPRCYFVFCDYCRRCLWLVIDIG